ncbi:hypothetical protein ACFPM3_21355 [Streptomyces coeruleoprunus]|uniref:Uncharacterized protein n=1 Tax=Streptomyces coeruleoprunus TaxID=285563 RepID=A0ABV9XHD5_9ACTN
MITTTRPPSAPRTLRHGPRVEACARRALTLGALSFLVPALGLFAVGHGLSALRQLRRAERFAGQGTWAPSPARARARAGAYLGALTLAGQVGTVVAFFALLAAAGPV